MFCGACGTRNEATARFCVQCGARFEEAVLGRKPGATPRRLVFLGLIGALLMAGIAFVAYNMLSGETAEDYSPSAKGTTWEFAIKVLTKDGLVYSATSESTAKGDEVFEGQGAIVYESRFRTAAGEEVETTKGYFVYLKDSIKSVGRETFKGNALVVRTRYVPGYTIIKLPLRVGASWEDKYEQIVSSGGGAERRSTVTHSVSIIGKERVNTPAGEFEALVFEMRWGDGRAAKEWRVKGIGVVRFSFTNIVGGTFDGELKNFHRSKS